MSSPPFASNIAIQYDDASPLFTDAGVTPVSADGQTIGQINDMSGNGYNAVLFAGRTGAVYHPTLTGGKRGITFSNQNVYSLGSPAGLLSVINSTSNWSVFWFGIPTTANGFIFSKCVSGSARVNVGISGGAINNYNNLASNTLVPLSGTPQSLCYCTPHTLAGVGTKMYLNGAADSAGSGTLPSADVTNPVGFGGQGGSPTGAYYYAGTVNVFLLYNRALLPPEVMQVSDYCFNYYGVPNPRKSAPFYIVWDSNSISMLGGTPNVPNTVQQTLGLPQGSISNLSLSGKSSTQIIGESPQAAWPILPLMREGKPILYLGYEGTNEAGGPNSIQSCIAAKAQGFDRAITATTTPGQTLGVFQTGNSYVRANWQTPACNIDGLVDLAGDPIAGNPFNWITSGYYSSDGLHPTNGAGVNLLAGMWKSVIKSVAYAGGATYVAISSIATTTLTVTCTAPTYGTGPYNIQFQQAPDVSGAPGAWANIGTNTTALTNAVTTLTQNTPYWFRAVTVDTGSTRILTTLWETATTTATAATGYTLTGPAGGASGVASTLFTVTPNGALGSSDTVTLGITGGGTCTPSSLVFPSGSVAPLTFSYLPATTGTKTLTLTDTLTLTFTGSPFSYTSDSRVATGYTVSGPNSGVVSTASTNFTFTPNGVNNETLTLPASLGTWSPTALSWASVVGALTATFTPTSGGTKALVFVSPGSLTFTVSGQPGPTAAGGWYYYSVAAATTFSITGSSTIQTGYGTAVLTITPSVAINDSVVMSDDGAGGTFSPTLLTFVNTTAAAQSVNYIARVVSAPPAFPIRAQSAAFATITGNPRSFTRTTAASASYVIAGPLSGLAGVASAIFTVTPKGVEASDTLTFSDGGNGGSFSPTSIVYSASALIQTFTYTPVVAGVYPLTITSASGRTFTGNGVYYTATSPLSNRTYVNGGFVK